MNGTYHIQFGNCTVNINGLTYGSNDLYHWDQFITDQILFNQINVTNLINEINLPNLQFQQLQNIQEISEIKNKHYYHMGTTGYNSNYHNYDSFNWNPLHLHQIT